MSRQHFNVDVATRMCHEVSYNIIKSVNSKSMYSNNEDILAEIRQGNTKLGDLRKIAKRINKDHGLALELWATKEFLPRQLAILIMEKKELSQDFINKLDADIQEHQTDEKLQLIDWLMANQLSKDKKTISLMESRRNSSSILQRRVFWYYQARLRWMGKTNHPNTEELLAWIELDLADEQPEVSLSRFNGKSGGLRDHPHNQESCRLK